jgi:hypothetical protein
MITIRVELSIAFSAAIRAVLPDTFLLIFQMVAEQPTENIGVGTEYGWGPGPEKAVSRGRDED